MAARIDSLSNHQVTAGQHVRAFGTGFVGVSGVQVGDAWADDVRAETGGTLVGFTVPMQPEGSSAWVVVHLEDGTRSPCEGDAQFVTYASSVLDLPPGELRIDALVPDTVTLGRADSYWVVGSGLSRASGVVLGNHAPTYETYDDTRLTIHIPETEGQDGGALDLTVYADGKQTTLAVPCVALPVPDPMAERPYSMPQIFTLDPESLPADGGVLTIHGWDLHLATLVTIGPTVTAPVENPERDRIVVTVPSLADSVGQQLGVEVIDPNWSSGTGSQHRISVSG